jgi:hypothetical protein
LECREQIDRRGVGPLPVVNEQDDGMFRPSDHLQEFVEHMDETMARFGR